jgi:hypothetical protein
MPRNAAQASGNELLQVDYPPRRMQGIGTALTAMGDS